LLNNLTLKVKDIEIARAVKDQNATNFKTTMMPVVYMSAIYALLHFCEFVVWGLPPIKLFSSFSYLFYALLFLIIRRKFPYMATRVIWFFLLHWGIQVNLTYRDAVPDMFKEHDKSSDDNSIMNSLVICHLLNHNSFLTTVILQPTLVLIPYYYQLVIRASLFRDPYDHTSSGLTPDQQEEWIKRRFLDMAIIVAVFTLQHYVTQRNMIIQVINNHMIKRQQTQMQSFWMSSPDVVVIASDPELNQDKGSRHVVLQNEVAN
jgi:hypothetical protein